MSVTRLSNYGFLAVEGRDAVKFLQGYTTCDLEKLQPGQGVLGAVCNIKGRMLTNFVVATIDQTLVIRMQRELVPVTEAFLAKYIVFSKATMRDATDEFVSLGLTGVPAPADAVSVFSYADGRLEAWVPSNHSLATNTDGDIKTWHKTDIKNGYAWVTSQTSEQYIPQMFQLQTLDGIDFKKGCYLGQEIVARMQYRGELKKRLHAAFPGNTPQPGDPVLDAEGKSLGEVVAAEANCCLAVLRNAEPVIEGTIQPKDSSQGTDTTEFTAFAAEP